MPWEEQTIMSQRQKFVRLVAGEGTSISAICRELGISRKTGYKWLGRVAVDGLSGLADRSRRPHTSPTRTPAAMEVQILDLRAAHPAWGGRKLYHWLVQHGVDDVPAPSTITAILARHGLLTPDRKPPPLLQRFEHACPNDLWQLDFMGHRPLGNGQRVHPLTLADHSRFALGLFACPHERQPLVQTHLTWCFQRSGLPAAILTDNGPPWGTSGMGGITALEAWLLRLGVEVWHGRASHPQTQGKVERLHGTLAAEVFAAHPFPDLAACQDAVAAFVHTYNHARPHEALGYAVPASRYQPSPRPFPATLPAITYGPDDHVRRVRDQGAIFFNNHSWFISRGLIGLPVAVRPTTTDGRFQVVFCQREVASIDLNNSDEV